MEVFILIIILILFAIQCFNFLNPDYELEVYYLREFDFDRFNELNKLMSPILTHPNILFHSVLINNYINYKIHVLQNENTKYITLKNYIDGEISNESLIMSNTHFLDETLLKHKLTKYISSIEKNHFFEPNLNIFFMGNKNYSKLSYDVKDNIYLHAIEGNIIVKLFLPNNSNLIAEYYNNDHDVYLSEYNAWDKDDIECVTLNMKKNDLLKIPRFWWYTIKGEDKNEIAGIYKTSTILSILITFMYKHEYSSF
jgi:hypothetical protein